MQAPVQVEVDNYRCIPTYPLKSPERNIYIIDIKQYSNYYIIKDQYCLRSFSE